ncbi:hypothetical protein RJT34_33082 [Clitoria ternatea]|uniref:Protein TIFY n=1 Tax=Clitoria ternatea TaxID=43366 RepID=A0AAN9I4C2_CLITE
MSSSSVYSGFSGHMPPKSAPEKNKFSQTCSLLSQYLKEKGSFGDLTLGISCTAETNGSPETSCQSATTMELFPTNMTPGNLTTMDLFSPQTALPRYSEAPTMVNSSGSRSTKEPKASQLTIFYGGQVVVFDEFPADKVEEIMSLANKGIPRSQNSSYGYPHNQPSLTPPNTIPQASCGPIVCDLPIARKASLHRFLEKRKDRITSKAPYQTKSPNSAPNKPVESISWLGLGAN